ncbi:hypothetical protein JW998_09935 [candidate division KSB1 bacterium]|nr:hypothetical protein [candidate division KSB1 bacterium]
MAFLSSLAVILATRLGLKLAEKKKWLPAGVYHQLAINKLKYGDLQDAIRLNEIALEKSPRHEKAQVVKDLIAMQRDALLGHLMTDIEREKGFIRELQTTSMSISRQLSRLRRSSSLSKFIPWLFLFGNFFAYLASFVLIRIRHEAMVGSLVGGVAVICTLLIYFLFRRLSEYNVQSGIKRQELATMQRSLSQELQMRTRRLRQLQSKLSETRHQLRKP